MRFRATVELSGRTATGIEVPGDILEGLGAGRRPAVRVTIGDYTYRSTVGTMDGRAMLPLSAEHRAGAGVGAGDEVDVEVELDTEPREVVLPPDFVEALNGDASAHRFFDGLSYSQQRWHVLSVEGAKTPETRRRRIARSIEMLREGRAR